MPKLLRRILVPVFALVFLTGAQAQVSLQHWTLEQTRQSASAQDRLFFLYFTADWCAPCRWMAEHTLQNAELAHYVAAKYVAVEIDIDQGAAALLRKQFEVEDIPSILVFSAAGQLIDRHTGTISANELQQWLIHLDQPVHHLKGAQAAAAPASTLSSPRAQLEFSRPALGRSQQLASPSSAPIPGSQLILAGEPVLAAVNNETFVPRDGASYAIVLTDTSYTYEEAITAVADLERKYQQRTELQPQENGTHRIILGEFSGRQAAQAFLIYLQRNNRQGEILTLGR